MSRLAFALLCCALTACGSDDSEPSAGSGGASSGGSSSGGTSSGGGSSGAGSRVLAMEINQPEGKDHAAMLDVAMTIGVKGIPPALPWSLLEPTPQSIDASWINALNLAYAPRALHVMLTVPTIDTVSLLVPSDLSSGLDSGALAFDDPSVIQRFQAVLDQVLKTADPKLSLDYFVVGNEVNIYLATKPDAFWQSYKVFIDQARSFIQSKRPNTRVGINVAFNGAASQKAKIQALMGNQDVCFVSYYLNGNDFGSAQANDLAVDVPEMLALCGDKPVVLKEFGYPTGVTGNSLDGQAKFVGDFFQIWDQQSARIPYVVISRMFDGKLTDCEAQATSYGFGGNQQFIQFLCTLGFRTYDDQPKPAWDRLAQETKARGF